MKPSLHKTLNRFFLVAFFSVFLAFSPSSAEEHAYWQKAGDLMIAGDLNAAIRELDRLLVEMPEDTLLLRLKGICFIGLEKTDQAVRVLRRAVEINPSGIAARFYLAKALAQRGSVLEAIDLLVSIEDMAPDSPYAKRAREIMPQLRSVEAANRPIADSKRWNPYISLAMEYDDNVPARSRHEPDTSTGSLRTTASGALEYRFIDQNLDDKNFSLGIRHSLYYSRHGRSEFSSYNLAFNSSDLILAKNGIIYQLPYTISLTGNYSDTRLGGSSYSDSTGISADASAQWREKAVAGLGYSVVWEDFEYDTDYPELYCRDGATHYIELDHYLRLLEDKILWGIGGEYRIADTDGTQFNRDTYNLFTSFDIGLPHDMSFFSRFDYTNADYIKYIPEPRRVDDMITISLSLTYPLFNRFFIKGGYTYFYSGSNLDFADYKREIFSLSLSYY
ncbi:MAG: tetratricopeptide repeat protein [Desulfobacterales bacterium]|nr:tetratricopeptide repeat protein [Desulfobacterales bacterium]